MGFVDVVGISTSYVKGDFQLTDTLANLLPMLVFLWFAVFSIPTGALMQRIGRKKTVLLSALITSLAMLIPLVNYSFVSILITFALLGIGNTILQVSLNPLMLDVVPKDRVTSMLTLGQFIKAISSTLGPVLKLLAHTMVLMAFLVIFLIVGFEVGLMTTVPKYLLERCAMPKEEAGLACSVYFLARTVGTFLGVFLLIKLSAKQFFFYSMLGAILSLGFFMATSLAEVIFVSIFFIGLFCANIFPIVFSLALQSDEENTDAISSLMIMGVAGGALTPVIMGVVADFSNQFTSLFVLLASLAYVLWAAFRLNFMQKER